MAEQKRERDIAEMEAQMAHDTDQYFEARPQIMRTRDKETTFEAGFKAAWKARALSHAEGEAVASLAIDKAGNELFGATFATQDLEPGLYDLYTHPAPQVAFSDTQEEIEARLADQLENSCPHCGGSGHKDDVTAPQVAVPEGYALVPVEPTRDMMEAAKYEDGDHSEFNEWLYFCGGEARDLYKAMIDAAPTAPQVAVPAPAAPAGEPDDSDICEKVELPHVLAWADGIRGDMWTEYADRITDEEARVAQAVWAAHTGEQPVSDPDGLPSDWRRVVEGAADMLGESAKQHRERGDNDTAGMCDRFGAMLRDEILSAAAPDEREIADWLSREIGFANAYADKHKVSPNPEARAIMVGRTQALQEVRDKLSTRLRAGKEGEPS